MWNGDLLKYGAILDALKRIDSLENFFSQIAVTFFKERRSIAYIDPFTLCLIQILLHNIPCVNCSLFIEKFIEIIYIPGFCFETNHDPLNCPSIMNIKKLLALSFHYGYLTRESINDIRTKHFSKILTTPIQNSLTSQATLQKLFDTLIIKYQQNPVSLAFLSTRKIRQSMIKVNQKNIEQLHLNTHLKNTLLTSK
ncbi:unnamed protein product [Adineta steineri]|uniref:Uncharacterized protein n=1 Tax=Adineta steineri TaxID=433720 RepID=A0A814LJV3_9BILA|nr:unnamed protein product [Adineta steineri]CAF1382471.1 unnamed protein product [Adineta steineri]